MTYNPNQPRDPAGSSTGGQWSAAGGGASARAGSTADLVKQLTMAYAKDLNYFESDAFSGGSGDAYRPEADLSARLSELHAQQDKDMERLGIRIDPASDPRRMWANYPHDDPRGKVIPGKNDFEVRDNQGRLIGFYGTREQAERAEQDSRPSHPTFDTEDHRSNMIAATSLFDEIIRTTEAAPANVREFMKHTPLNIEYVPSGAYIGKDGETLFQGGAIRWDAAGKSDERMTLIVHRSTSVQPDVVPHEMGHVYAHALSGEGRRSDLDAMDRAFEKEGGVTEYADAFRKGGPNWKPYGAGGLSSGASESLAEVEAAYARTQRYMEAQKYDPADELNWALSLARGTVDRIGGGSIPGWLGKPAPATAAAWIRLRNVETPAPKDIKRWTESDFKRDWTAQRIFDLAAGKPDPGMFDPLTSPAKTRARWSFLG